MFRSFTQSERDATRGVQHLLNVLDPSKRLAVDGVAGSATRGAFGSLTDDDKALVVKLAEARNPAVLKALQSGPTGKRLSHNDAIALARAAIRRYGEIPVDGASSLEMMEFLLSLEPAGNKSAGYVIESRSPSGDHIGIYQMGYPAWKDVKALNKVDGMVSWEQTCFNPALATEAAVLYCQLSVRYLRAGNPSRGVPPYRGRVTKEVLYGAYNQGAIGFLKGAPALQSQSSKGKQVITAGLKIAGLA